jgi:natural resistance-associated macrophage protein 2
LSRVTHPPSSTSSLTSLVSYLDPGNLEADLQAGAYTKYQLTWVLVVTSGIGLALQAMSVKLGIVTGKHLAQLCRQEYSTSKWVSQWIMAEVSIIASDVQAVVTSAIALKILFKLPLWIGCILTAFDALTFLSLHLLGVRSLEGFFVAIVCVMSVCFFWTFSLRPPDPLEVMTGLIPSIPSYGLSTAVGVVGSLILPQNYFVHRSSLPLPRR